VTWGLDKAPSGIPLTSARRGARQETEQQLAMRQVESGSWVSDEQTVRHVRREVPWCLEDGSRARLPVLKGAKADEVHMETVGARARRPPRGSFVWRRAALPPL